MKRKKPYEVPILEQYHVGPILMEVISQGPDSDLFDAPRQGNPYEEIMQDDYMPEIPDLWSRR